MFIGYQNGKVQVMAETKEELENMPCVALDKIEEVEFAEFYDGKIYIDKEELAKIKAITKADLTAFVSAEADKVAYGGITVVADENEYLFKTDTDNIARCGAVMPAYDAMADDSVIPWEVWKDGLIYMLPVSKVQFKNGYLFGVQMTVQVQTVKGALCAEIQNMTDEQLADEDYVMGFKGDVVIQFAQVNTVFQLNQ